MEANSNPRKTPAIEVRQATMDDRPAIASFLPRAYAGRWEYKYPARWEWAYVDNPFLEEGRPPVWIAVTPEGEVVGQTCALIEPLQVGDELRQVAWSVDTFLDPAYRGQGVGYRLQEANDRSHEIFMSLSMSAANRHIKSKLGSVPVDAVSLYVRTVRHVPDRAGEAFLDTFVPQEGTFRGVLENVLRTARLDRALAAVLNRGRMRRDARRMAAVDTSVEITPVARFDPHVDDLWARISPAFHALVRRDQTYLNWKYVQQPHMDYQRYVARSVGQEELLGYLILRKARPPEPNVGVIADLFAPPDDQVTLYALVAYAVDHFNAARVASVQAATTIPEYQAVYEAFGFREVKEVVPMAHIKPETADCQRALTPGSWFFGKADHDWDQYPLA
jgi:GNAT superfamily N-acetyltransferase